MMNDVIWNTGSSLRTSENVILGDALAESFRPNAG